MVVRTVFSSTMLLTRSPVENTCGRPTKAPGGQLVMAYSYPEAGKTCPTGMLVQGGSPLHRSSIVPRIGDFGAATVIIFLLNRPGHLAGFVSFVWEIRQIDKIFYILIFFWNYFLGFCISLCMLNLNK